ncbi:ImmA/IrrE family metallo-endopeptidase [Cellulomonas sp. 179-A 4D5 NHS]|uniref:ImmA/IrrE family metallo-endopeptidase n=1 Tax=Cellulomonas sp. 179-A 4D5 NHS TaxID=3142378 RepID=UPI00399FCC5F
MVAQTESPVTPDVVRWAITEDGRTREALADALHVSIHELDAWLMGNSSPSRGQVSDLARVLRRPRALFFLPAAPEQATTPPAFRHPPGDTRDVGTRTLRAYRRARRVQQAVAWARGGHTIDMPMASKSAPPERAAAQIRAWLGVSNEDQSGWGDDRAALAAWRAALEERDVLVFSLEIGEDEVRGFSSWDAVAPMLAVNVSSVTPAARIFTLGHELAHLVLRSDAACIDQPPTNGSATRRMDDAERWCEEFAAALLMPRDAVASVARERRFASPAGIAEVKALMSAFRVSARAAALRLIDLGLAERSLYGAVITQFAPKKKEPAKTTNFRRPSRSTSRIREYGGRTLATVLSSIPETDAMSVLRVDWDDVRKLADEVPGVRAS